jgi:hypothetical protein
MRQKNLAMTAGYCLNARPSAIISVLENGVVIGHIFSCAAGSPLDVGGDIRCATLGYEHAGFPTLCSHGESAPSGHEQRWRCVAYGSFESGGRPPNGCCVTAPDGRRTLNARGITGPRRGVWDAKSVSSVLVRA